MQVEFVRIRSVEQVRVKHSQYFIHTQYESLSMILLQDNVLLEEIHLPTSVLCGVLSLNTFNLKKTNP
jgi:hypothetical protein